jgi:hypothetical protein
MKLRAQLESPLLTGGTDTEEFESMCHGFVAVAPGNSRLLILRKTLLNFHYLGATRANQVMMMTIVAFLEQFMAGNAIAKVKSLHDADFFQQTHAAVDRGEIAFTWR